MILVDSSIWIDHFAKFNPELDKLLGHNEIVTHDFIVGELALGTLASRAATLRALARLPHVRKATVAEVAALIEWHRLFGTGLSYVDVHLIASLRLESDVSLWTRDKRLLAQADRLGLMLRR